MKLQIWGLALCALFLGCTDRSYTPTMAQALQIGTNRTIFAVTSRAQEENGNFGSGRSTLLRRLELTVSIPPSHTPGQLEFAYAEPDPYTQFTMANRREFETQEEFRRQIQASLKGLPPNQQEVTVFIHGYNATQAETAFRAAQLAHDVRLPGATVIYSWPSRGRPTGYVYDQDSMLFARDGLEALLKDISKLGAHRVVLVAHSLGAALAMETLRQIELSDPGWSSRALGGVVLISPDLNVELFREQVKRINPLPKPFVVFVSSKDRALNVSSRLRGGKRRLGNIKNISDIADLPIEIIDTTAFSKSAGSSHFVPATSPALIAMLNQAGSVNDTFDSEHRSLDNILTGNVINVGGATRIELLPAYEGPQ